MAEVKTVSLKLLVDSKSKKVLFAEAGKEFVDFLFHILSLPLGTVVKLITKKSMVGCVGDLYKSIESLNDDYIQPNVTKNTVLKPLVSCYSDVKVSLLSLPEENSARKKLYRCTSNNYNNCRTHYSDGQQAKCPSCHNTMSSEMTYVIPPPVTAANSSGSLTDGGYVKGVVTYMVMDNLEVRPMSTISGITLINTFNVKDVAALVEKEVKIGLSEGVALLKASLQTKAVLSSVFL